MNSRLYQSQDALPALERDRPSGGTRPYRLFLYRALIFVIAAVTVLAAIHLLYSVYCAYTHGVFELMDYGVYTNMIWNSGHGHPFRMLVDRSYLYTHLSYTLLLLGPLFRVWDSPMLLIVVQWLFLMGGCAILVMSSRRHGLSALRTAVVAFFYVGYVFSQSTLFFEFHGVSVYLLLVPWLYYCLSFRKRLSWLPLLLILGVREDAFIFVLPLLLYFAVRDRWKVGYVLALVAVLYGLLAMFVLYPEINGVSLFERRSRYIAAGRFAAGWGFAWQHRARGVTLALLPALAWLGLRSWPALVFMSLGLLVCMLSSHPAQQYLGSHYAPPVMTCLAAGLVESAARTRRRWASSLSSGCDDEHTRSSAAFSIPARCRFSMGPALLIVVTVAAHVYTGYLIGGGDNYAAYMSPGIKGGGALHAAGYVPREGVLLTERRLTAFTANRKDILAWNKFFDSGRHRFDIVFLELKGLAEALDGRIVDGLRDGSFGITYFDGSYVVMQRGADTRRNGNVLDALQIGAIALTDTPKHAGVDRVVAGRGPCRYWEGKGHRAPVTLSYGMDHILDPGTYQAVFFYRAAPPEAAHRGSWGRFSLHPLNRQETIAHAEVPHDPSVTRVAIPFDLENRTKVEVRVTGEDAALWVFWMYFEPLG